MAAGFAGPVMRFSHTSICLWGPILGSEVQLQLWGQSTLSIGRSSGAKRRQEKKALRPYFPSNAKAADSWHNFGLAFDVVPLVNGKAVFDSPFWNRIGELGKQVGLTWGGDFQSFKDKPHFEFHPNLTLAQANQRRENNQNLLA